MWRKCRKAQFSLPFWMKIWNEWLPSGLVEICAISYQVGTSKDGSINNLSPFHSSTSRQKNRKMLLDELTSTYVAFESSKNYVMMIDGPANMIWSLSNSQKRSNQPSTFFYVAQKANVVSLPMAENQQLAVKFVHFLLFLSDIFHDWNSFFPAKWMLQQPY